jgi:hypothetical protein
MRSAKDRAIENHDLITVIGKGSHFLIFFHFWLTSFEDNAEFLCGDDICLIDSGFSSP